MLTIVTEGRVKGGTHPECGLAVAPPSSQGHPECREELIAQSHLICIVFRRRDR